MSIYDTLYNPSFETEEYEITPEEAAKEYVEGMRKYKMALHESRVMNKISKFLYAYKKDRFIGYNAWRPLTYKPPLPTPESRKRFRYTLKTDSLWSKYTSTIGSTTNSVTYDYCPSSWITFSYK